MLILIRYGEIALKSRPVRRRMEQLLARNIRLALEKRSISGAVSVSYGRLFLETPSPEAAEALKKVFGIVSFSECKTCPATMEAITKLALEISRNFRFKTFAVNARRVGTHTFTSREINEKVGAAIADTLKKKVNLTSPELTVSIDVRDKKAYLHTGKIQGPGGLPVGSQGKALSLVPNKQGVSSSILAMKRGCLPVLVFTKESLLKHKKDIEEWSPVPLRHYFSLDDAAEKEKSRVLFTTESSPNLEELKQLKSKGFLVLSPLMASPLPKEKS